MRQWLSGFFFGVVISGTAWVGATTLYQAPSPSQHSRPDQLWEQDRGAAIKQYHQQRQHDILQEQQLRTLQELKHQPC